MYDKIVYIFHLIVLIFIVFGWLIFPEWSLKYQMLIVPLVFLDWNLTGSCSLTILQDYFEKGKWDFRSAEEGGAEFYRPILNKLTGREFDRIIASRINYMLFITAWMITYYKFLKYHNIRIPMPKIF